MLDYNGRYLPLIPVGGSNQTLTFDPILGPDIAIKIGGADVYNVQGLTSHHHRSQSAPSQPDPKARFARAPDVPYGAISASRDRVGQRDVEAQVSAYLIFGNPTSNQTGPWRCYHSA